MTTLSALYLIAGIWFLAVTIPGPNFIVVSQHALAGSRRSGLFIALGVSSAACIWATSSLLGLRVLFEHVNWLYNAIRLVGGIYICLIGARIILGTFKNDPLRLRARQSDQSAFKSYRLGILTSFSNPKTAAFFGSIFVTTFPPDSPLWAFLVTLVLVFTISVFWYSFVAVFFSLPRIRKGYFRVRKTMDRVTGSLLIVLGIRLAISRS